MRQSQKGETCMSFGHLLSLLLTAHILPRPTFFIFQFYPPPPFFCQITKICPFWDGNPPNSTKKFNIYIHLPITSCSEIYQSLQSTIQGLVESHIPHATKQQERKRNVSKMKKRKRKGQNGNSVEKSNQIWRSWVSYVADIIFKPSTFYTGSHWYHASTKYSHHTAHNQPL